MAHGVGIFSVARGVLYLERQLLLRIGPAQQGMHHQRALQDS
jgi:hypothetical protein